MYCNEEKIQLNPVDNVYDHFKFFMTLSRHKLEIYDDKLNWPNRTVRQKFIWFYFFYALPNGLLFNVIHSPNPLWYYFMFFKVFLIGGKGGSFLINLTLTHISWHTIKGKLTRQIMSLHQVSTTVLDEMVDFVISDRAGYTPVYFTVVLFYRAIWNKLLPKRASN